MSFDRGSLLAGDPAGHQSRAGVGYLVLVENSVADSGHEHHRDQEGNKAAVRHGVPIIFDKGLEAGRDEEKWRGSWSRQSGDGLIG